MSTYLNRRRHQYRASQAAKKLRNKVISIIVGGAAGSLLGLFVRSYLL